jgi:O-acetylhomoserine/O-acetylserine sulfhydrylase-like pyridoxal-dependent enzyme
MVCKLKKNEVAWVNYPGLETSNTKNLQINIYQEGKEAAL